MKALPMTILALALLSGCGKAPEVSSTSALTNAPKKAAITCSEAPLCSTICGSFIAWAAGRVGSGGSVDLAYADCESTLVDPTNTATFPWRYSH